MPIHNSNNNTYSYEPHTQPIYQQYGPSLNPQHVQPVILIPQYVEAPYYDEGAGASSSFSMAICTSLFFLCFGCFFLSCVPYWFVYITYRNSDNPNARAISGTSKILFWVFFWTNICFFFICILVVVIIPPCVVYSRSSYYYY